MSATADAATLVDAVTVFLAGAECPFTCVFCDLWRFTLEGPTPPGAIPAQLRQALEDARRKLGPERLAGAHLKLYNASNFFESRAVPEEDDGAILELLAPVGGTAAGPRVVVECHPRLLEGRSGARCRQYAEALPGRLEVALGLETAHPAAALRLGKGCGPEDFDRAVEALLSWGAGARAFVLVGAPFVPAEEALRWALHSVEHAARAGAGTVSLIPVRSGNGALEELATRGDFVSPTLRDLEDALDASLASATVRRCGTVVTADLWDLATFGGCASCFEQRRRRLEGLNLSGLPRPRVACQACD